MCSSDLLVREIVGDSRETVDRRNVRAGRLRQQARRDRKILVVLARQVLAPRVGRLDYHSVSGTPA